MIPIYALFHFRKNRWYRNRALDKNIDGRALRFTSSWRSWETERWRMPGKRWEGEYWRNPLIVIQVNLCLFRVCKGSRSGSDGLLWADVSPLTGRRQRRGKTEKRRGGRRKTKLVITEIPLPIPQVLQNLWKYPHTNNTQTPGQEFNWNNNATHSFRHHDVVQCFPNNVSMCRRAFWKSGRNAMHVEKKLRESIYCATNRSSITKLRVRVWNLSGAITDLNWIG